MSFANIKNSKDVFKTYLKSITSTFSHKYKKSVFQTSIKIYLFRKLLLLVILRNFFRLENFVFWTSLEIVFRKYKKSFFWAWKIGFWVIIRTFLSRNLFFGAGLGGIAGWIHFPLLISKQKFWFHMAKSFRVRILSWEIDTCFEFKRTQSNAASGNYSQ